MNSSNWVLVDKTGDDPILCAYRYNGWLMFYMLRLSRDMTTFRLNGYIILKSPADKVYYFKGKRKLNEFLRDKGLPPYSRF